MRLPDDQVVPRAGADGRRQRRRDHGRAADEASPPGSAGPSLRSRPARTDRPQERGGDVLNAIPTIGIRRSTGARSARSATGHCRSRRRAVQGAARRLDRRALDRDSDQLPPPTQPRRRPTAAALARSHQGEARRGTLARRRHRAAGELAGGLGRGAARHLAAGGAAAAHAAFTTGARSPTDTGPPGNNAERASALVSRFRQIAELATRVTNARPGATDPTDRRKQLGRRTRRKRIQPRTRTASSATRKARSRRRTSPAPAAASRDLVPTSAHRAAASDGRTVAFEPLQAIATGGDTPLGRALTRAVVNDPSRNALDAQWSHAIAVPKPTVVSLAGSSSAQGTSDDAAVEAFVSAFAAALDARGRSAGRSPLRRRRDHQRRHAAGRTRRRGERRHQRCRPTHRVVRGSGRARRRSRSLRPRRLRRCRNRSTSMRTRSSIKSCAAMAIRTTDGSVGGAAAARPRAARRRQRQAGRLGRFGRRVDHRAHRRRAERARRCADPAREIARRRRVEAAELHRRPGRRLRRHPRSVTTQRPVRPASARRIGAVERSTRTRRRIRRCSRSRASARRSTRRIRRSAPSTTSSSQRNSYVHRHRIDRRSSDRRSDQSEHRGVVANVVAQLPAR